MDDDRFEYEGLEDLEERLRTLDEDATYLVLFDRTDRNQEKTVGRFDLDEENCQWMKGPYSFEEALDGACQWLRSRSASNTLGEPVKRYRVRVYGPKGFSTLVCGSFACRALLSRCCAVSLSALPAPSCRRSPVIRWRSPDCWVSMRVRRRP